MKIRTVILWSVAILILGVMNLLVYQREDLAVHGKTVLLQLAPVDPRSLIQGDYMVLRYALADAVDDRAVSDRGSVVVRIDERNIAHYARIYAPGMRLAQNELLLPYRRTSFSAWVGPQAFFFQEGQAEYYEDAEYGELRVSKTGRVLLVGLRDAHLQPLGPP